MQPLSPSQRRALKARAHALKPVVLISDAGLSESVLAEIDRSLERHELIKIRVAGIDRRGRDALFREVCERTGASAVQHIGRVLVAYRRSLKPLSPSSALDEPGPRRRAGHARP